MLKKAVQSCSGDIAELIVKLGNIMTFHVASFMPTDLVLELPRSLSKVFSGPVGVLCVCS